MNNAEYFKNLDSIKKAWKLRMDFSGDYDLGYDYMVGQTCCYPKMPHEQFEYAFMTADTGFAYEIGEIVSVNGKYDIVDGYVFDKVLDAFRGIRLRKAGEIKVCDGERFRYKSDVPKEVVDLVRSQLQSSCPLKEAACR